LTTFILYILFWGICPPLGCQRLHSLLPFIVIITCSESL